MFKYMSRPVLYVGEALGSANISEKKENKNQANRRKHINVEKLKLNGCSSLLSFTVINTVTKRNLGKKRV